MTKVSSFSPALSRRTFLAAAGVVSAGPFIIRQASAKGGRLVINSWGGPYSKAITEAYAKPFTAETGVEVVVADGLDLARVKTQLVSGAAEWDIFEGIGTETFSGGRNDFWAPLNRDIVNTDGLSVAPNEFSVPNATWAAVIAWDPARNPDAKRPALFADLFNLETFPGWRGIRTRVSEILEIALLADGVQPAELYPLDVERGFAKLDQLKGGVKRWIDAPAETVTLLAKGEVEYTISYDGRLGNAKREGVNLDFARGPSFRSSSFFSVLKNSKNRDLASKFIAFALRPDRNADFAQRILYAPAVKAAWPLLPPDVATLLAPPDSPLSVTSNDAWWADNFAELQKRYNEWRLLG